MEEEKYELLVKLDNNTSMTDITNDANQKRKKYILVKLLFQRILIRLLLSKQEFQQSINMLSSKMYNPNILKQSIKEFSKNIFTVSQQEKFPFCFNRNQNHNKIIFQNDQYQIIIKDLDVNQENILDENKFDGHSQYILAIDSYQDIIVSSGKDFYLKIWNISQMKKIQEFKSKFVINLLKLIKKGEQLIQVNQDQIQIREMQYFTIIRNLREHTQQITSISYSEKNSILLSCSLDQHIIIWDSLTLTYKKTIQVNYGKLNDVAINDETNELVAGGDDRIIRAWSLNDYSYQNSYMGSPATVLRLKFSKDCQFLISVNKSKVFQIWNCKNQQCIATISTMNIQSYELLLHPDPQFDSLFLSNIKGEIHEYRMLNNQIPHKQLQDLECQQLLLVGYEDKFEIRKQLNNNITNKCLKLWTIENENCVATSQGFNYQKIVLTENKVCDNKFLVIQNNTICLWDVNDQNTIKFQGNYQMYLCYTLSPDGLFSLMGQFDGGITIWNIFQNKYIVNRFGNKRFLRYFLFIRFNL